MKIALFSDVHANFPALEAMFLSLDKQHVDSIFCLGDLVGYNVWPNEVINEIRRRKIQTLAGNHDAKVTTLKIESPVNATGKNYAYHLIDPENKNYLHDLPAHIRLEFQSINGTLDMLMVHGSTRRNDEYVLLETPEEEVLNMMETSKAGILCVAHSHKPYHRIIHTHHNKYVHVINTGSVGKPKDGNVQGGYVLLDITANTSLDDPKSLGVEFVRFDYDVEKAAKAVEDSPLPNELADMLRKAY
ncbi:MAG TPA: metallophosphoesterase family protein [Pseudosphingobacterium sp.]|nr:metallophosphoesterase family protein [Pseudosphingobacterium sp.]